MVRVRGALRGHVPADPDLVHEQVVGGGATGQVAGAGRVGARGGALLDQLPDEGGPAYGVPVAVAPGAADTGAVDVVHPSGEQFADEHLGRAVSARLPQLGPLGAGDARCGGGRGGGTGGGAGAPGAVELGPSADAGEGPHDERGDDRVERIDEEGGFQDVVAAPDEGDEGEHGRGDGQRVPAETEGLGPDERQGDQGPGARQCGADGRAEAAEVVADDPAPGSERRDRADEPDEDGAAEDVVRRDAVPVPWRGGAVVPPVAGSEGLEHGVHVRQRAAPVGRPDEQADGHGDQHPGDGGGREARGRGGRRRDVAEPPDAETRLGARGVQPFDDGVARPGGVGGPRRDHRSAGRGRCRCRGRGVRGHGGTDGSPAAPGPAAGAAPPAGRRAGPVDGGAAGGRPCDGGPAGRGTGGKSFADGGTGGGAAPPNVSRDSYVPSVSMNPCPLTSQVAVSVPPSI